MTAYVSEIQKILAIALNTYREIVRDRIFYSFLVFVVFIILLAVVLGSLSVGQDERILRDFGLAAIGLIGGIIAIFAGCNLVSKEIDKKTIFVIFTKPVTGWQFIAGKYLGLSAAVLLMVALMGLFMSGVLAAFSPHSFGNQIVSLLLPVVLVQLELLLVIAIATFFSTFATPVMSVLFTLAMWLIAHLGESLNSLGKLSNNHALQTLTNAIYWALPDLANLTRARNLLMYGNQGNNEVITLITCYIISYVLILLVMASIITEHREFS
ncbi:MAG: ABC transporter permease [Candidatus Obscuribacterales bacterium]|nr:ABC transporter permease [Candidatus Obscuribacterales bacterium]